MHSVLVAVSGDAEPEIVARIAAEPDLIVERRCADVTELLAAAGARVGTIAVVSASFFGIDRVVIDRLHTMGVLVVGVASPEDMDRVAVLQVDAVTDSSAGGAAVVDAIRALDLDSHVPPTPPAEELAGSGKGKVIAVWGTHGAPGRTTVAVAVAEVLGEHGSTLVIDADTVAPSIAQTLGIVDEASGIAVAARAATNGRLTPEIVVNAAPTVRGMAVMTGLTRPDRWRELPSPAIDAILGGARDAFDWIVVDVTGGWEDGEPDFGSAFAPGRGAAQHAVLAGADHLIVVGQADPVGMYRLVSLLADKPRVEGATHIAVTKVRSSVTGSGSTRAVTEVLVRLAGEPDPVLIADDRAAFDAALRHAKTLIEVAPESKALAGIRELAGRVTGRSPSRRSRRRAFSRPRFTPQRRGDRRHGEIRAD